MCRQSIGKIQLEDAEALLRLLKHPAPQLHASEVQACSLVLLARFGTMQLRAPLRKHRSFLAHHLTVSIALVRCTSRSSLFFSTKWYGVCRRLRTGQMAR